MASVFRQMKNITVQFVVPNIMPFVEQNKLTTIHKTAPKLIFWMNKRQQLVYVQILSTAQPRSWREVIHYWRRTNPANSRSLTLDVLQWSTDWLSKKFHPSWLAQEGQLMVDRTWKMTDTSLTKWCLGPQIDGTNKQHTVNTQMGN